MWHIWFKCRISSNDERGNDNEIISCNIEEAYTNLKLDFEGWDYKNSPRPQQPAFFKWLKKHLAQGYAVAVMIMSAVSRTSSSRTTSRPSIAACSAQIGSTSVTLTLQP